MYLTRNLPKGGIRISITANCNMNCHYCHNEGQPKGLSTDMEFSQFKNILDTALSCGVKRITITGGEPMINKEFDEIVRYCSTIGLDEIGICTNGTLIRQKIDVLIFPKIHLAIGIDTSDREKISKQSN